MLPPEALEAAAQVAQEAPRQGPGTVTALGLLFLVVSQLGVWLDKLISYARARADRKKAEAEKEEARLAAARLAALPLPPGRPGNGDIHKEFILPHSVILERHTGEISTLKASTEKLERENREDHGKIFTKLDELKDILIEEESRP